MGVVNELCILSPSLSLSLMIDYAQCSEITNYTGPVYIYTGLRARDRGVDYSPSTRCWLYMRSTRPAGWGLLVQSSSSKKDGCMGAPVATPYRSGCPIVHPHGVDYGILYSQDQAKDGWAQSNKKTIHARNVSWCWYIEIFSTTTVLVNAIRVIR